VSHVLLCLLLVPPPLTCQLMFNVQRNCCNDCPSTVSHAVDVVRSSQPRVKLSSCNHLGGLCHDPCHAKFFTTAGAHQLPLTHCVLTVSLYQILRVLNRLLLYSYSKSEHPYVGDHSCTTGNRSRNLCYDSWRLSHPGYLYPGTTPVMIKFDHNRSCPWV